MATLVIACVVFSCLYFPLRLMKDSWEKGKLPKWSRFASGVLAWGSVGAFGGILYGLSFPIVELFTKPSMGTGINLIALSLGSTALAKLLVSNPEILDLSRMRQFFVAALRFENPARKRNDLHEELERKTIRSIHRETSGKPFPTLSKPKEPLSQEEIKKLQSEILQINNRSTFSPHLKAHLAQLKIGKNVDISDEWKINSFKISSHDWYEQVTEVLIVPQSNLLSFRVNLPSMTRELLQQNLRVFDFKQDLYGFLQAVSSEKWLQPYASFFETITVVCYGLETDGFGTTSLFPFFKIEIAKRELKLREGTFYSVTDLHTISSITFNNGDPIS